MLGRNSLLKGDWALAEAVQRTADAPSSEAFRAKLVSEPGQPDLLGDNSAHGKGVGTRSLMFLLT